MEAKNVFLQQVDKLIDETDLNRSSFETKVGLSNGTYNKWRNGSKPTIDTVVKIAKCFGKSTDYLLGLDTPDNENVIDDSFVYKKFPFINRDSNNGATINDPINKYVPWEVAEELPDDFYNVNDADNPLFRVSVNYLESYCFNDIEENCTYYLICKFKNDSSDLDKKIYFCWYNRTYSMDYIEKDKDLLEDFFNYLHSKFKKEQRKNFRKIHTR